MTTPKLLGLLAILSPKENKALKRYLSCHYFNRKAYLVHLFQYLQQSIRQNKPKPKLDTKQVLKILSPNDYKSLQKNESAAQKKISNALYDLKKQVENFLVWQELQNKQFIKQELLLNYYIRQQADDWVTLTISKMQQQLNAKAVLNYPDLYYQYTLTLSAYNYGTNNQLQSQLDAPIKAMYYLDACYILSKLMHTWTILGRSAVVNDTDISTINLVHETLELAEKKDFLDIPLIKIFYLVVQSIVQNAFSLANLSELKQLIITLLNKPKTDASIKVGLHNLLLNYCHHLSFRNISTEHIPSETWELFKIGLKHKLLLRNGYLSYADFWNITKAACAIGKQDWARHFVESYGNFLHGDVQQAAIWLSKAAIAFSENDCAQAITYLNKREQHAGDIDKLLEKNLRLQCYYELQLHSLAEASLEALRKFLARNQTIGYVLKTQSLNFCKQLKKLLHHSHDKVYLANLKTTIQTTGNCGNQTWLLNQIEALL